MIVTRFLMEVWTTLLALAPWLFAGAGLAAFLKYALPERFISRHVSQRGLGSILKSVAVGIPLPLCSCGVIPAAVSMKKEGASNGAVTAFLISTPQTGVDSILVTASFLGWPIALFKVLAAFLTGTFGGWLVDKAGGSEPAAAAEGGDSCPCESTVKPSWALKFRLMIRYAIHDLIGGMYKYLLVGVLLAAVITLAVPKDLVAQVPAMQGILGMLLMLAVAAPMYVCATGSVAIAAALIHTGLPLGSALVFLMAGPATNITEMTAIYKLFGKRLLFIYLAVIIAGSIGMSLLFQTFFAGTALASLPHHTHAAAESLTLEGILGMAAAAAFLALSARWGFLDLRRGWRKLAAGLRQQGPVERLQLRVKGMTCKNCVAELRSRLENIHGVRSISIDLESGRTDIAGFHLNRDWLLQAVQEAGYTVEGGKECL